MDQWLKNRIIEMHKNDMPFPTILEVTGKTRKEVEGVLGEHYSKPYNRKQKEMGKAV